MAQHIGILGRGKLATALERSFARYFPVLNLSREDFDARQPYSVDSHLKKHKLAYVFNTVVLGGLDACAADPAAALAVNTLFPLHLAELSRKMAFMLVHFSTDSVFSDLQGLGPHVESSPVMPPNMYGYTKFGADSLIPMRTQRYVIYRLPVMFGPTPTHRQFLEYMIDRVRAGESLRVAADVYSHAVYSLDVAQAVREHLAQQPLPGLYHLAGEDRASLYELLATAAQLLGYSPELTQGAAADFQGMEHKNCHIHLASEKMPSLRSWRESLAAYCESIVARPRCGIF